MDKVARLPASDRAALFGETGAGRGVADTIIEKDFWVCWTLKRLFALPKGAAATLVFKGAHRSPRHTARFGASPRTSTCPSIALTSDMPATAIPKREG